jgi:Flp pilus assembly pilin Flp
MNILKKFINDESGFVVTLEYLIAAGLLIIGVSAGLANLRDAINAELQDTAKAVRFNQSYSFSGNKNVAGSQYMDNNTPTPQTATTPTIDLNIPIQNIQNSINTITESTGS